MSPSNADLPRASRCPCSGYFLCFFSPYCWHSSSRNYEVPALGTEEGFFGCHIPRLQSIEAAIKKANPFKSCPTESPPGTADGAPDVASYTMTKLSASIPHCLIVCSNTPGLEDGLFPPSLLEGPEISAVMKEWQ